MMPEVGVSRLQELARREATDWVNRNSDMIADWRHDGVANSLAVLLTALLERVQREEREACAAQCDERAAFAKSEQGRLLERRDPVYGIGSADSLEWDKHQRAAGMAHALATTIRVRTKSRRARGGTPARGDAM